LRSSTSREDADRDAREIDRRERAVAEDEEMNSVVDEDLDDVDDVSTSRMAKGSSKPSPDAHREEIRNAVAGRSSSAAAAAAAGRDSDRRDTDAGAGAAAAAEAEASAEDAEEEGLMPGTEWLMVFANAEELKFALGLLKMMYQDVWARMVFNKTAKRAELCIAQLNSSRTALNVHTVPCTVYVAPHVNTCPMFRVPLQSLLYAIDSAKNETPVHIFVEDNPRTGATTNDLVVVVPAAGAREQDTTMIKMLEWDGTAPSVSPMKPDFTVTMPVGRLLNVLRVERSRIKFTVLSRRGESRLVFRIEAGNESSVKRKEVMHDIARDVDDSGATCGTRTIQTEPLTVNRFRTEASSMGVVYESEFPGRILSAFLSTPQLRPQTQIVIHLFAKEPLLLEATLGGAVAKLLVPPLIPQEAGTDEGDS